VGGSGSGSGFAVDSGEPEQHHLAPLEYEKKFEKRKKTAEKEHYKHPATMTNVWIGARL